MKRFIVLEGADASGKSTQVALLVAYLKKNNPHVLHLKFPKYDSFYGRLVAKYLGGELGALNTVSPYLISLVYALDRAEVAGQIKKTLLAGGVVICDRYTPSNIAYHGVRLAEGEREAFTSFIEELEYEHLGIPREEVVVFLKMDLHAQEALLNQKGDKDIHEQNGKYSAHVRDAYTRLSVSHPHWITIDCTAADGTLLPIDTIHQRIVQALKQE